MRQANINRDKQMDLGAVEKHQAPATTPTTETAPPK